MVNQTKWEYRIHVVSATKADPRELNRLGREGWEIASAVGVGELGAIEEVWCFLKRALKPAQPPRDDRIRDIRHSTSLGITPDK